MSNMFKDSHYVIMSFLIIPPRFTVMFVELEENDGREKGKAGIPPDDGASRIVLVSSALRVSTRGTQQGVGHVSRKKA